MRTYLFISLITFILMSTALNAQSTTADNGQGNQGQISNYDAKRDSTNRGTVGIITGSPTGTYIRIGSDLANVLNGVNDLRVIPMVGIGAMQNIDDILYLKGVDIGIVQADILDYIIDTKRASADIKNRIAYIAKLYNEEAHLFVAKNIASIQELANKKVNLDKEGTGTAITGSIIFKKLNIPIEITNYDQKEALEKLRSGEISGMFYVAGKPADIVNSIKDNENIKLVEIPYDPVLQETYLPSKFSHEDYPNLIKDKSVQTIATSAVMAIYNWPENTERYKKVTTFITAFFQNFDKFLDASRHKKWKEVSLSAKMPGWTRFAFAEQFLTPQNSDPHSGEGTKEEQFNIFVKNNHQETKSLTDKQSQDLFKKFKEWSRNR